VMGPNSFWNVDYGTRDRMSAFAEWEALWNESWLTQIGVRMQTVKSNAGPVQGYNAQAIWASDAALFNSMDRQRIDTNWDLTALTRYTSSSTNAFEVGFARKSHAPNLYQRYAWSTQPMASLMNNFVGDGNAYIGNTDLKPEIANTLSASADWHDAESKSWNVKATSYVTYVDDYIDAQRCNFGQCGGSVNLSTTSGFVSLQFVNQSARLYGLDLSGSILLATSDDLGSLKATGILTYVRGQNLSTGDNLYNIMPLNAKFAVVQSVKGWTNTAEVQFVADKSDVSHVRNEVSTPGYGLLNLRTSFELHQFRFDFGIENLLNGFYSMPLGGAYVGQGASMTNTGIPWGTVVPGMGRSINVAVSAHF